MKIEENYLNKKSEIIYPRSKSKLTENNKILHQKFIDFGHNAKEWMKKCALLLPEIDRMRIWEKKRFGSIYEYAAKLAGMSRYQVNEALRVLAKIKDMPALIKVVEEKGINSVKPVVTIATKETETFWANKARKMSKHTLATYIRESRKCSNGLPGKPTLKNNSDMSQTSTIIMELSPKTAQQLEKLKGNEDWESLMKEYLKLREEKPAKVVTDSKHIPVKIQRFVIKKTNGQCAYPGCTKKYEFLHHTKRNALYREHDPDCIVPLCKEHEQIAHQSLIEHEEKSPDNWHVRKFASIHESKFFIDQKVMQFRSGFT